MQMVKYPKRYRQRGNGNGAHNNKISDGYTIVDLLKFNCIGWTV